DSFSVVRSGANDVISLNGNPVWTTPYGSLSTLTINGLGGNDSLNVNLTGDQNVIPSGGLTYNGGTQTSTPGDSLTITGGDQGAVTYNYTSAHDGSIAMSNFGTVNYTGLEPIVNTG